MEFAGKAHVFGRDIDTDAIIAARYLNVSDPDELAAHCMEDIDPDFVNRIQKGDIVVAGENFGCGSSREHAPITIKATGISAVVAKSFARIFYRNSINIGLPILECPEAVDAISDGDELKIDADTGEIVDMSTGQSFKAEPFPEFINEIINEGGLVNRTRRILQESK